METLRIAYKPEDRVDIAIISHCDLVGFVPVEIDRFWMDVANQSKVGDETVLDPKSMSIVNSNPKAKEPKGNNLPWKKIIQIQR